MGTINFDKVESITVCHTTYEFHSVQWVFHLTLLLEKVISFVYVRFNKFIVLAKLKQALKYTLDF